MPKSKRGDNRAEDMKWGEGKKPRTFLLTDTASDLLDDAADAIGTTRSETLEQLIRAYTPLAPNFPQACNS